MKRRKFITALAGTLFATSSGCLSRSHVDYSGETRLGWYAVSNRDTESHRFGLRVERDGEEVHQSSHEISGRDGNTVHAAVADCTWSETAGNYSVFVRLDGGKWVKKDLTEIKSAAATNCVSVQADYRHGGFDGFSFWVQSTCANIRQYDGGCGFAEVTTAQ